MPPREEERRYKETFAARFCLALASVLVALLLCEAALRVLFPKYRGVAEGQLQPDDMRIYASPPDVRDWRVHPDTGRGHPFHTNNLGLHQHRDFSDADILSATTVGVFGDSFVRFGSLDAPHAFTEPLDYLLNLDGDFTVLNFGVGGYGPAQSYFHYRSFPRREALDYVLFAYYGGNDLIELVRHGLFDLDDDGRLRQREMRGSAWWVPLASKLHLTYLALDATGRLAPYIDNLSEALRNRHRRRTRDFPDDVLDHGLAVFGQLIRRWRTEVEGSGGEFFVVLLPTQPDFPKVRPLLERAGVGVVDLNACYESRDDAHRRRSWEESPYRLENDFHWNELGNRLAAACLDEWLRRETGLPALVDAVRDAALAEYYAAFEPPGRSREQRATFASARSDREAVRRKYQALGGFDADDVRTGSPDDLVLHSNHYDVYLTDSLLVFATDDCRADDATERLFAHATPVDGGILPPHASHLAMARHGQPLHEQAKCIARYWASRVPVSHILVGQRDSAKAVLWSGEIVLDRAAFEKTLSTMLAVAGEPVIESGMDVHVHGRRVFYVSDDCEGMDGRTPFLLRVTPLREEDLPPQWIEHGYDNLDFHQVGVAFGERCVVRWQLPDYPIRRIRTGQYVQVHDGSGGEQLLLRNLWEGEADIGG